MSDERSLLSYLGECYVRLELAKRNYKVIGTKPGFFFDLLGEDAKRIEVKAALPSKSKAVKKGKEYIYKIWQFRLSAQEQRGSYDFIVCVVFEEIQKSPQFFIFPKGTIKTMTEIEKSGILSIFESDISGLVKKENKLNRHQFLNNWNIIIKDSNNNAVVPSS